MVLMVHLMPYYIAGDGLYPLAAKVQAVVENRAHNC